MIRDRRTKARERFRLAQVFKFSIVAAVLFVWLTLPAQAEIRTGSGLNRYLDEDASSSTRPELARADVRYDDATGELRVVLNLVEPMADPRTTSALRAWRFRVVVGDYLSGICSGDGPTSLAITGSVGDEQPAVLDDPYDLNDEVPDVPVSKSFSADRSQVFLVVANPRLRGLPLICGAARLFDSRQTSDDSSDTYAFLFDGFDAADGALLREAEGELRFQGNVVALRIRKNGWSKLKPSCHRTQQQPPVFSCRASGPLTGIGGRPVLSLRGTMTFDPLAARRLLPSPKTWTANMRARLTWHRCPAAAPKRLRGKPCRREARWRGTGTLSNALNVKWVAHVGARDRG